LGDFLVGRRVGRGGFADVHLGRQLSTGRKVAIKILHDGRPPEEITRFQREAAYLAQFNHPNIVQVLGFGQAVWIAPPPDVDLTGEEWFQSFKTSAPLKTYIALEWIEGRTLEEVYQTAKKNAAERPSVRTLADWFAQAAGALAPVHALGI